MILMLKIKDVCDNTGDLMATEFVASVRAPLQLTHSSSHDMLWEEAQFPFIRHLLDDTSAV